jgi:hypothetical protein
VVENAPPRTHVFEAPGFFEQSMEEVSENATVTPMRVYVAPGETVHVQVSTAQLSCEPETDGSEAQTCPFFCPLHIGGIREAEIVGRKVASCECHSPNGRQYSDSDTLLCMAKSCRIQLPSITIFRQIGRMRIADSQLSRAIQIFFRSECSKTRLDLSL